MPLPWEPAASSVLSGISGCGKYPWGDGVKRIYEREVLYEKAEAQGLT
jgi:hypothetical protein